MYTKAEQLGKRKNKKKKPSRKTLVKKADTVFAKYIRQRDKTCVLCGKSEGLTCGHLNTRSTYMTRWNEDNAFGQCYPENLRHEYDSHPFNAWFIRKFTLKVWEHLHRVFSESRPIKNWEIELIIEYYTKKLDDPTVKPPPEIKHLVSL